MKFLMLQFIALVGVSTAFAGEDNSLESVMKAEWVYSNYTNDKYGIAVTVQERPENERKGTNWARGSSKVIEIAGTTVLTSKKEDDNVIAEIRVPLSADTIEYLFAAKDVPDYVRSISASHITDSNLSDNEQLRLLKGGINHPDATLRYYIWCEIRGFNPQQKVADLLHLGLRDPCITIAHECLGMIIDEYDLQSADGSEIEWTTLWQGLSLAYYIVQHSEILEVAETLQKERPDLISLEELTKIRNRAMPSDEWFEFYCADRGTQAREYFLDYAAKTRAELGPRD